MWCFGTDLNKFHIDCPWAPSGRVRHQHLMNMNIYWNSQSSCYISESTLHCRSIGAVLSVVLCRLNECQMSSYRSWTYVIGECDEHVTIKWLLFLSKHPQAPLALPKTCKQTLVRKNRSSITKKTLAGLRMSSKWSDTCEQVQADNLCCAAAMKCEIQYLIHINTPTPYPHKCTALYFWHAC